MRRSLCLFLAIVLKSYAVVDPGVVFAAEPTWVTPTEEPTWATTPANEVSYGYDFLLLDRQVNVGKQAEYWRSVYRITSESSLQSGARLTWNFDPSYQQLTLHHVRVIRDGVVQERLNKDGLKIIQRESDLERHSLNGESTAYLLLDDIRVGDVIDYANTQTGWNPTFGGKHFRTLPTRWAIPVRNQVYRLLVPSDRSSHYKMLGGAAIELSAKVLADEREFLWRGQNLQPVEYEKESPHWFITYPFVQFTEFNQWAEVVQWAVPLYALPPELPPAIKETAARLTQGLTQPSDQMKALLHFVQTEVRYLGMQLGAGSYQPTPPAEVLARRFGDCKGKTVLFCALMQASGLRAYPALVNTTFQEKVSDWLPSPHAFDHVIACIPQDQGYLWVDPTLRYQQGELGFRGLPDYGRALVVRPGINQLTTVELPMTARSTIKINERFDISDFEKPADFSVTTVYTGRSADAMRQYFAENTAEQITKNYVNYYATDYPGLKSVRSPQLTDDARENRVTIQENYAVSDLWKKTAVEREIQAAFFPRSILNCAVRPETSVRTKPLSVDHPVNTTLLTTITLPEDWSVKSEDTVTEDFAFRASQKIACVGKKVTLSYSWESRADHVPVERVAKHVEVVNSYRNRLGYSLTYKRAATGAATAASDFRLNWMLTFVLVFTLALAVWGAVWVGRFRSVEPPLLVPADASLVGIGGWLILVSIGVTVRPLMVLFQVVPAMKPSFDQQVWDAMTIPGGVSYQPALGSLIVIELVGNVLVLVGCVLQLVLFYQRKKTFHKVFITVLGFTLLLQSFDAWAVSEWVKLAETDANSSGAEIVKIVLQALIWIPYMLVSRRVKATFTR